MNNPKTLQGKIIGYFTPSNDNHKRLNIFHVYSVDKMEVCNRGSEYFLDVMDVVNTTRKNISWNEIRGLYIMNFPKDIVDKTIQFNYYDENSPRKQHRVKINEVLEISGKLYVQGYDLDLMQTCSFRVDKMQDLIVVHNTIDTDIRALKQTLEKAIHTIDGILTYANTSLLSQTP